MDDKRAKGLCYFCDDKFERGHICKGKRPQLFHLEFEEAEESNEGELGEVEEVSTELAHISLNAIAGLTSFQTMRVTGYVGKKSLQLLLDNGSTHNFLDCAKAAQLGCVTQKGGQMNVTIADGSEITCCEWIKDFVWTLEGHEFKEDVYLVPLGVVT